MSNSDIKVTGFSRIDSKGHVIEVDIKKVKAECKNCGEGCNIKREISEMGLVTCDILINELYKGE